VAWHGLHHVDGQWPVSFHLLAFCSKFQKLCFIIICIVGYHIEQRSGIHSRILGRGAEIDNFYTGLSPHEPWASSGFVITSDQVCSQGSLVTRSMVGMYFSHGFGVYSHLFGVYLSVQWFPKLYTDVLWNIETA